MEQKNEIIIYQSQDGTIKVDVLFSDETVWLTIDQMATLFGKSRSTINEHILNAYSEGELVEDGTKRKIGISDFSTKPTNYYNLDVIISVGYRVKSIQGTQFRIWATQRLRDYIIKGFALNDERFKSGSSMNYFRELLDRIREIRLSERVFYQQIKDIYATKLLQKSEMRKNMVMDLIYRGFIYAANYSESHFNPRRSQIKTELRYLFVTTPNR